MIFPGGGGGADPLPLSGSAHGYTLYTVMSNLNSLAKEGHVFKASSQFTVCMNLLFLFDSYNRRKCVKYKTCAKLLWFHMFTFLRLDIFQLMSLKSFSGLKLKM